MSTFRAFLVISFLLIATSPSQARVQPPLQVRLLDDPRPAEEGQVFRGRLQIVSGHLDSLSHAVMKGKGWTVSHLKVLPGDPIDGSAAATVEVTATILGHNGFLDSATRP